MSFGAPVAVHFVDAFTSSAFKGNPAAVCILPSSPTSEPSWSSSPDSWMRNVAVELNQPMTAFMLPCPAASATDKAQRFLLRWISPTTEAELCGHATLAASYVLFSSGQVSGADVIHYETKAGMLEARCVPEAEVKSETSPPLLIELDFPVDSPALLSPSSPEYQHLHPILMRAFAPLPPGDLLGLYQGKHNVFALLSSASAVTSLTPDLVALRDTKVRGVGVTAEAGPADRCDFVSRFFAPAIGIDEDAVTGSAHCMLAALWGDRLGRKELVGYQASARGGEIRVRWDGDRVKLRGHGVITMRGQLLR